jgi:hypothetical protein
VHKYYECHITVEDGCKDLMEKELLNTCWKFSQITDDLILGPGNKMYATAHFSLASGIKPVRTELDTMAGILEAAGLNVVRRKIELVLYDTKNL